MIRHLRSLASLLLLLAPLAFLPALGAAQGHHEAHRHATLAGPPATAPSPYAGQEARDIKALSPEEVRALQAGSGMGLAKAAELNHYPGPRHVLDLAEPLRLSSEQRATAQIVFAAMRKRAVALGEALLARETELDGAFSAGAIDAARLEALTAEIGRLQGALRAAHLAAHLEMKRLLTPAQVQAYDDLRGYATAPEAER